MAPPAEARVAAYGTWPSPLSLDRLVEGAVGVSYPMETASHVYWSEARPAEGGRVAVVRVPRAGGRAAPAPGVEEVAPGASARTLVHEYGGLCVGVDGGEVVFADHADQRMYRVAGTSTPAPITPVPPAPRAVRYAVPVFLPGGRHLACVRERHQEPDDPATVVNDLVALPLDGSAPPRLLAGGHDFYAHLARSPDGRRLCWVCWDHPDMPWDSTTLWEADVGEDAAGWPRLERVRRVAGGAGESVIQPAYTPDGRLLYVSDRTGFWNLYEAAGGRGSVGRNEGGTDIALAPMQADLGAPDWVLGTSSYACLADGRVVATWSEDGTHRLGVLAPGAGAFRPVPSEWSYFVQLRAGHDGASALAVAGSPAERPCVVRIVPEPDGTAGLRVEVLHRSAPRLLDDGDVSVPEHVTFPSARGRHAHALFYAPANREVVAPVGALPPLVVRLHSGPTSAARVVCDPAVLFWTTRGFAVADVDYGGSTGYGRAYRELLRGEWGVVDVEDCVHCVRHLAATGRIDGGRAVVHGGSAGGFTVLRAVTTGEDFAAGATYYAVADARALARGNHKFELHYNDGLIGPLPAAADLYRQRSPIEHAGSLRTPLIVFHGLEDPVVPPAQSDAIVAALDAHGVPHAYVTYEGEGHGFRKASTLRRTAEAELYFYGKVLGFTPADDLEPVEIVHEDRLAR